MAIRRTQYNQDLYPQAGNMDWIKDFADNSLKKISQKAIGLNQITLDFQELLKTMDVNSAKSQIIEKYDPDDIYDFNPTLDKMIADGTVVVSDSENSDKESDVSPLKDIDGDGKPDDLEPTSVLDQDKIDARMAAEGTFNEIQRRLNTNVSTLQELMDTISKTPTTEENKEEIRSFSTDSYPIYEKIIATYNSIKNDLPQISIILKESIPAPPDLSGPLTPPGEPIDITTASNNTDMEKNANWISDIWNKLKGGKKGSIPQEQVNTLFNKIETDYNSLSSQIKHVLDQNWITDPTSITLLKGIYQKAQQYFKDKASSADTVVPPTSLPATSPTTSPTDPSTSPSKSPKGKMRGDTGTVTPTGDGGGSSSVAPDMMSLFDPANENINYEQIEKYQNMVLSVLKQTALKLKLTSEKRTEMDGHITSIFNSFNAIASIVSEVQTKKEKPAPESKGTELEEVEKERSPFFK